MALRALADYDRSRTALRGLLEKKGVASPPAERALARDLALGVVRRLNTLDWVLAPLSSRPFVSLEPSVRAALRLGAYQLLFASDRFPAHAALFETVSLVHPAARGLVNAVLRTLQRKGGLPPYPGDAVESLSLRHSYPAWIVRRWRERWGDAAEGLLAAGNAEPPLTLRANRLKASPADLAARLAAKGAAAAPTALSPDGVRVEKAFSLAEADSFIEGLFSVQDEAAQLAVHALDPRPGETVLDLCAGVGGKSTHIAERLGGKGRVVAVDSDDERLKVLKANARRLGLPGIEACSADVLAAKLPAADRVLLDAPCSGLGTIRRRPDIKWARGEKDVAERLPALQKGLLLAAAARVKPGGVLVYATCSTEPEENEGPAGALLAGDASFRVEAPAGLPAGPDGFVRLRPDLHGTDGFFIAKFRKAP